MAETDMSRVNKRVSFLTIYVLIEYQALTLAILHIGECHIGFFPTSNSSELIDLWCRDGSPQRTDAKPRGNSVRRLRRRERFPRGWLL